MSRHPECFKPWCGIDGKKCVDCASYNAPKPFVQPAIEAVRGSASTSSSSATSSASEAQWKPGQGPHVNDGTKQAHAVAPLDTSELPPVRYDPISDRLKAKVVRQALEECSKLAFNTSIDRARLWHALAVDASDEELNKLRLLLK